MPYFLFHGRSGCRLVLLTLAVVHNQRCRYFYSSCRFFHKGQIGRNYAIPLNILDASQERQIRSDRHEFFQICRQHFCFQSIATDTCNLNATIFYQRFRRTRWCRFDLSQQSTSLINPGRLRINMRCSQGDERGDTGQSLNGRGRSSQSTQICSPDPSTDRMSNDTDTTIRSFFLHYLTQCHFHGLKVPRERNVTFERPVQICLGGQTFGHLDPFCSW
mmetsp:Transcript_7348/g.10787  ORF Transcript_7348/g.10787 Transcript_7348/m.10787 type:complete len:218 (+) Transcript_7348:436-1089(+)